MLKLSLTMIILLARQQRSTMCSGVCQSTLKIKNSTLFPRGKKKDIYFELDVYAQHSPINEF